jgi:hypothetical protein
MKGTYQFSHFLLAAIVLCSIMLTAVQDVKAQTIYTQDEGFFSPILSSFFVRSNIVESTQKIGPMAGYRFNENFDIALHAEYFSNESKSLTEQSFNFSMMNIGILAGYTDKLSDKSPFTGRVELRAYRGFLFSSDTESSTPRTISAVALSSLYYEMEAAENITFRPNIGTYVGFGDYQLPTTSHTSTNPTQAFNGFQFGPKVGFDTSIHISGNTTITAVPALVMKYNQTSKTYNTDFEFSMVLNF